MHARPILGIALLCGGLVPVAQTETSNSSRQPLTPKVEIEETVYSYTPANNGAGPMWCSGSTCLVRVGGTVVASGLETIPGAPPLNNCRWTLFHRNAGGWELIHRDERGRTREPSPLTVFPSGEVFLSANPTLSEEPEPHGGPARPEIWQFSAKALSTPPQKQLPRWDGQPKFREHSYRSFAADGARGELILFQNIDYTHAEWSFRDASGQWAAQGQLKWPWGAEYDKPQPIRVCYPNVALKDRAAHFCGVSDILEPYAAWREYKKQITGREWDYDFRRLFYAWSPDITRGKFHDWVEIASRDKTCGWISPGDLWVDPEGSAHLLWTERATDDRLREKFFPEVKQTQALNYAIVREGQVTLRRTLAIGGEGESGELPSAGRFHVTPDHRLFAVYYVQGQNAQGQPVSENRILEIRPGGETAMPQRLPLERPFNNYFTATVRAGSPPSHELEMLGQQAGKPGSIQYARIRLRAD